MIIRAKPLRVRLPVVMLPPTTSMTSATPRWAPLSMPSTEGPASGLRKAVCSNRPLTDRAAPHIRAVTAWGMRFSTTMYCHEGWSGQPRPSRMSVMARTGMLTLPL